MVTLFLALALAGPAGNPPATGEPVLTVPYLPQTEALCGGAAAAMVFRFWGDRRADVQQFEPLVDRAAGGIAETVLIDAIRRAGWRAEQLQGSVATIREHLQAGHPLVVLIEDRPRRYHYVVVVGTDERSVFLHDPTWGPSRRVALSRFLGVWQATNYWTLLVTPEDPIRLKPDPTNSIRLKPDPTDVIAEKNTPARPVAAPTACDQLLDEALDEIDARGLSVADEVLGRVRQQCPTASGPIRELAGVRFSQERWGDAATLAEEALDRDPNDAYSWDLLGSSRFIRNDAFGALRAWNRIGKPRLDSVQIQGLTRTRYALVADIAGLTPNTLLTDRQLALAARRLQQLPDRVTTRVGYRQETDGFATVDVAIVERSRRPRGLIEWTGLGGQALINREVALAIPGRTGQGDVWGGSWRWWDERPRVAVSFTAPRPGRWGGVWRVDAAWEAETYALENPQPPLREERKHGSLAIGNWLTPNLRYEVSAGFDSWDRGSRALSVGGTVDHRFLGDRLSVAGSVTYWAPVDHGAVFAASSIGAGFRSNKDATGFVALVSVRADAASVAAPLALWSGAGEGRARPGLLRAHALLQHGVIDGAIFGRRVGLTNVELQRWLNRPALPRIGVAAFVDAAGASRQLLSSSNKPFQVDAGVGVRLRVPGTDGTIRLDYGRGLRDRANALTIGWTQ